MLKLNLELDILNLSVEFKLTNKGISSCYSVDMNDDISEMLTEVEAKKIKKNLDEISETINKAVIRDVANEITNDVENSLKDKLSFEDFIGMVNKDEELRNALDTLVKAINL